MKLWSQKVWLVLFLGIGLQLVSLPLKFHGDMVNFDAWASYILENGPSTAYFYNFAAHSLSNANYPPLLLWLCVGVALMAQLFQDLVWQLNLWLPIFPSGLVPFSQTIMPFIYIFKFLILATNIGIAVLSYIFAKDAVPKRPQVAVLTVALLLFNPALIYGTTIWGQIDILPIFFIFAAIYCLLYKKQILISSLLMVTALLLKQTTVIFIPFYLLAVWKYFDRVALLKSLSLIGSAVWLSYAPFVSRWENIFSPLMVYLQRVQFASDNTWVTKYAWNSWHLIVGFEKVTDTQPIILGLSYERLGFGLLIASFMMIAWHFWKSPAQTASHKVISFMTACFLVALAAFLFLTRLHERHLLQALPFFIILYLGRRDRLLQIIGLSLFVFANMLFIWHPVAWVINEDPWMLFIITPVISAVLTFFGYYLWNSNQGLSATTPQARHKFPLRNL